MEEFYRRKYLSPSYNRSSSYVDTLQKDKTVAQLRKELHDCKQMQDKFDDLCLEIVKLERENKKIESEQSQIEADYMEKIKNNKTRITELKQAILDLKEDLEAKNKKIKGWEADNEKLLQELQKTKREAEAKVTEKEELWQRLQQQENLLADLKQKIEEGKAKCVQTKRQNQIKSSALQSGFQNFKKGELKLKEEQLEKEKLRQTLQELGKIKAEWGKKVQISKKKLQATAKELQAQQIQTSRYEQRVKEGELQREKQNQATEQCEGELKRCIVKSKEGCQRVKNSQWVLMQSFKNLQKDQVYLQKTAVRQAEMKKGNERLQQILVSMEETLAEEHQTYNRIIAHMKFSIQQDEKAIQSLSKQASLLEHIVN